MNTERAKKALEQVAVVHNTTVAFVRRQINEAILMAKQSDEPQARRLFDEVPCFGEVPTAEEFVAFLAEKINPGAPKNRIPHSRIRNDTGFDGIRKNKR